MAARLDEAAIFDVARRIGVPEARRLYLGQVCAEAPDLRARVEALLRVHDEDQAFLATPADGVRASAAGGEGPGSQVGPYLLLEQIGEGGFGVVYLAQQKQPVRRTVAVKVLKPGMDSKQVVARFEAERQALALMDHPNIARIFDGGTTASGRPYFVMELVKGVPLTTYCDQNHLTPRQRLELFVLVCQAVQHAHQKGVIHRDLKPSNVLVVSCDRKPVPKIIDFGVAKALGQQLTERTLVTGLGGIIGTLEYMSPEQAEFNAVDVDTRADVYSLGVLLYELLTGTTPLDRKRLKQTPLTEALRLVREEEPPRPSTRLGAYKETRATASAQRQMEPARLTREVRGDLDWIVMKALEKDRDRRYETANGLARDVQRYLSNEPVQACPPSAAYQLRKFIRRNRYGLAVAGLVLFFVVVLGSVAGWAWRDREARAREAELERAAWIAEQSNHLERAVERAELRQREGKYAEALAALERARLLAGEVEATQPLRQRIDALERLLDAERRDLEFVARFEAILREELSEVGVQANLRRIEHGNAKLRKALEQYGIAVGVTPPADAAARIEASRPAVQNYVVAALDECLCFLPVKDAGASRWFADVLQASDSDPWRRNVRHAWFLKPQDANARSKWAGYWYDQAVIQSDLCRYTRAIRDFSKAIEIEPEMIIAWHSLDLLCLHAGDAAEHRKLCGEMLARVNGTQNLDSLTQVIWSCVLAPESVPDFRRIVELAAPVARDYPAHSNNRLLHGAALYRSGQWKAAVEEIHESQRASIRDVNWPAQELFLAMAHMRLGQVQDARRWLDAAAQWHRENQGAAWWARVLTEILFREAEALIKSE